MCSPEGVGKEKKRKTTHVSLVTLASCLFRLEYNCNERQRGMEGETQRASFVIDE